MVRTEATRGGSANPEAKLCSPDRDDEVEMRGPLTEEQKARMPQLFAKGQSGNPRGASRLTMLRTHENARKAVALREKMLDTLAARIATIEMSVSREFADQPEKIDEIVALRTMALLTPDVNRLLTDSENRGLGAPRQVVDLDAVFSDSDSRRRPEDFTDEELASIIDGHAEEVDLSDAVDGQQSGLGREDLEVISSSILAPFRMDGLEQG